MLGRTYFYLVFLVGSLNAAHLRDLTKRIYIGSTGNNNYLNVSQYAKITAEEFNMLTPEYEMKWEATEPQRGQYTYELADRILAFAEKNQIRMRGHNLVWHEAVPSWVYSLDKEALHTAIKNRIINELTHYKGKIYAWDVVNEVFDWNGTLRTNTIFYKNFGESYISEAFILSRKIDPSTKLYINDYSIEGINQKSNSLYSFVKKLRSQGVPIDGVGFQCHFALGQVPQDLEQNLRRFIDLGVEVAITELDVGIDGGLDEDKLKQQAKDYATVFKICKSLDKCVGVTTWDWCDKYTYNPAKFPDLWDSNFKPKPAVQAVADVIKD